MNREKWLAFLRSDDPEAKELLQRHPGLEPPENDSDLKTRWKDPGFRARHAAAVSAAQHRRWRAYRRKPSP